MPSRTRCLWVWLHKYLGLATAAVMLLSALTGSILVFWREVDVALNSGLYKATAGPGTSVASALYAASAAAPAPVFSLRAPDPVWLVWVACSWVGEGTSAVFGTTHVDPGTGLVLGSRNYTRLGSNALQLAVHAAAASLVGHRDGRRAQPDPAALDRERTLSLVAAPRRRLARHGASCASPAAAALP